MKTSALILLALLAVGSLCANSNSFATVGEALDASFLKIKSDKSRSLGEMPIRFITFSANNEKLFETLMVHKLPTKLASLVVSSVESNLKDTFIRTTGIITSDASETITQKIVCAYRTGKDSANDYICLFAQIHVPAALKKTLKDLVLKMEVTMKKFAESLPTRLRNLHAFTTKGFDKLRGLGSAESQAKLTEFLNESAKNKDDAYQTLRKNENDPFVAKLFKNGLTHFTSSASVDSLEGVERALLQDYYTHLIQKMGIPENTQGDFRMEMELAALGSRGEWKSVDFLYKNAKGSAKYVNVMCSYDDRLDEADFLIADVQATFELGPDLIVSTSTKSSFFGLFSKTSVKLIYIPAELTEKSIQLIFEFFKLAALEKFTAFRRGGK